MGNIDWKSGRAGTGGGEVACPLKWTFSITGLGIHSEDCAYIKTIILKANKKRNG